MEAMVYHGCDATINTRQTNAQGIINALGGSLGADVAMEAVGLPETFEQAVDLVRPGGHVVNIGVHGVPASRADLDQEPDHHHRAGQHQLHADLDRAGPQPPDRYHADDHPPLLDERIQRGHTTYSAAPPKQMLSGPADRLGVT